MEPNPGAEIAVPMNADGIVTCGESAMHVWSSDLRKATTDVLCVGEIDPINRSPSAEERRAASTGIATVAAIRTFAQIGPVQSRPS